MPGAEPRERRRADHLRQRRRVRGQVRHGARQRDRELQRPGPELRHAAHGRLDRRPRRGDSGALRQRRRRRRGLPVGGLPVGGLPFGEIDIGSALSTFGPGTITHVIAHELGHAIGVRHFDFFNRSISCGAGGNEGDGVVGAILMPGAPSGATAGGSIMSSCFRSAESGSFTASDRTALRRPY
jgi:hypothetical protein